MPTVDPKDAVTDLSRRVEQAVSADTSRIASLVGRLRIPDDRERMGGEEITAALESRWATGLVRIAASGRGTACLTKAISSVR